MEDLFARLDRERQAADRLYNDALTALDRAIGERPERAGLAAPPLQDAARLEQLNLAWKITPQGESAADRSIKGRLRGFIWSVVAPTAGAQERFNAALVDHLNRNAAAQAQAERAAAALVDAARRDLDAIARFEWLLLQYLQTVTGYVDTKIRSAGGRELREQIALVQQRLAMVERHVSRGGGSGEERAGSSATTPPRTGGQRVGEDPMAADLASVTYLGFEDRFRGSKEAIRARLEVYVPLFAAASDVLDIGCGRGELLDLLREQGLAARGIDANQAMVDECRARGLAVERADAVGYLERQPDASVGGLAAIQVVEHLEPPYLARLLEAAYRTMRPGAPLVLETINAACWMAFFETYLRDLTHARPLHPETLQFVVQASGFTDVNIEYRAPVAEADRLPHVGSAVTSGATDATRAIAAAIDAHADKLNARLFSSMDYAIVARR
jgi:2-polyprenyl-3-methyl-5-hydroxy-6-metoxy-1,4-benzoquinol methylase